MNKMCLTVAAALVLTACGGGPDAAAVAACAKEVQVQSPGKSFELDQGDMKGSAKPAGENQIEITSTVCYDCSLPTEKKQGFTCKVRFDPANPSAEPSVVGFTFVW